jgi:CRISPR/Cas system CSM-associated protein Csm3 (group 7 of RAMP superfamily)
MSDDNRPLNVRIDLAIALVTPLCVGAAGSSGGLADKALQRDGWNRPIIPGSQLKGRVRHTCERIAEGMGLPICAAPYAESMCPAGPAAIIRQAREPIDLARAGGTAAQCAVCAIFGSPTYISPLSFGDLAATPPGLDFPPQRPYSPEERLRPGVGIDRARRTVLEEVLYLTETTDSGLVFQGAIRGRWLATPPAEAERLIGLLLAGLALTTRWGGGSSRGLGWSKVAVRSVTLDGAPRDSTALIEKVRELCATGS